MQEDLPEYQSPGDFWLRLDNAAKIYPAIRDKELTSVFRVSVYLREAVKARQLLDAVHEIEARFPYYKVKLKAGFFWYYLEPQNLPVPVEADQYIPCRAFKKSELMFRVLARENRISVEFSHILTDGTGAFEFLKTLLLTYLHKCGVELPDTVSFMRSGDAPDKEEYEDAYKRYFKKIPSGSVNIPHAFHPPFALKQSPRFDVLTAIVPLDTVLKKAKEYEVSLTVYLTAVYLHSLQAVHDALSPFRKRTSRKIIRIEVPINLRRMFPSVSMRNFSLYVIPGIDLRLGQYTFEELVKTVYHQMALETDKKLIGKMISRNVGGEKHPFIRRVPLVIKSLILSKLYRSGTNQYSGVVTNLGKIDIHPEINKLITKFSFIPPPPNKILKVNCGVVGFANELVISFGNITSSKEVERHFFTFLSAEGIPVKMVNY